MAKTAATSVENSGQTLPYRIVRFPGGLDLPCIDMPKADRTSIYDAVTDAHWIGQTIDFIDTAKSYQISKDQIPKFGACYVMAVDGYDICKIGYTANPTKRMMQIRTGIWSDLTCHALLWSLERPAGILEMLALAAAKKHGCRLRGEWVGLSARDATQLVIDAVADQGLYTSSEGFMRHWIGKSIEPREGPKSAVSIDDFYDWAKQKYG